MKITFHTVLKSWKNILNYIFLAAGTMMFFLFNTAVASEPKPWQMDLQEPAGIIATKATDLHNFLLVVITLISVFVLGLLVYVCIKFREKPNIKPPKTSCRRRRIRRRPGKSTRPSPRCCRRRRHPARARCLPRKRPVNRSFPSRPVLRVVATASCTPSDTADVVQH